MSYIGQSAVYEQNSGSENYVVAAHVSRAIKNAVSRHDEIMDIMYRPTDVTRADDFDDDRLFDIIDGVDLD